MSHPPGTAFLSQAYPVLSLSSPVPSWVLQGAWVSHVAVSWESDLCQAAVVIMCVSLSSGLKRLLFLLLEYLHLLIHLFQKVQGNKSLKAPDLSLSALSTEARAPPWSPMQLCS